MKNRLLDKIINIIAVKIKGTQFENHTFVVGGFVRDMLLKNERNDLDFVVDLPDGGVELANFLYKQRVCSRPVVYKRFGTAMVQMKGNKVEFVMTRNEDYKDKSRHPEVGFASLKEDAFRRDFTINSLYYNISNKKIYDFTDSGLADLDKKLLRSTSNPDLIFKEDPLRILRAIRFSGRLNFTIEAETMKGIISWRDYLQHISVERIKDEFVNMIMKKGFAISLGLCYQTGIIKYILAPLIDKRNEVMKLIEKIDKFPADLTIKLALLALAVDDLDAMEKAIIRLTINKKLAKQAMQISDSVKQLLTNVAEKDINNFVYYRQDILPLALEILAVSFPSWSQEKLILEKLELFKNYEYPLNGNDVIYQLKLRSSKDKNYCIKQAKRIWIDNPEMGKREIIEKVRKMKS